jgi:Tfp pilus assembly protein PilN
MEAVNLLPLHARPGRRWATVGRDAEPARVLKTGMAVACVVAVGLGLAYVRERSLINDRQATLADVQTQVVAADAKAAPIRAAQAGVAARMPAATRVTASRITWEGLLADLSAVLPRRVRLQTLSMQSPTPLVVGAATPAAAPTTPPASTPTPGPTVGGAPFTVSGVATSHVRVALVLDRLAALPWLSNVQLVSSTSGASLSAGDTFSVNAGFNPGGGQ